MGIVGSDVFTETVAKHFPGPTVEEGFIADRACLLTREGFSRANTLSCVALCRDEVAGSLVGSVESTWGPAFDFASLAGMVTAGRTGFAAALGHAPIEDGQRHIIL